MPAPAPVELKRAVLATLALGYSGVEVAARFGVSESAVSKWRRAPYTPHPVPTSPPHWQTRPGGVRVWVGGEFPEPDEVDLVRYRACPVPVPARIHPSCGIPGSGRDAHRRRGEPVCPVCVQAESTYNRERRAS